MISEFLIWLNNNIIQPFLDWLILGTYPHQTINGAHFWILFGIGAVAMVAFEVAKYYGSKWYNKWSESRVARQQRYLTKRELERREALENWHAYRREHGI